MLTRFLQAPTRITIHRILLEIVCVRTCESCRHHKWLMMQYKGQHDCIFASSNIRSADFQVNCCVTSGVTFTLESNLLRQDEMEGLVVLSPKQVIGWVFSTVSSCLWSFEFYVFSFGRFVMSYLPFVRLCRGFVTKGVVNTIIVRNMSMEQERKHRVLVTRRVPKAGIEILKASQRWFLHKMQPVILFVISSLG